MFSCKRVPSHCCGVVTCVTVTALVSSGVTAAVLWFLNGRTFLSWGKKRDFYPTEDDEVPLSSDAIYESETSARQYMEFHYTPSHISFDQRLVKISESFSYPVRIAQKFKEFSPNTGNDKTMALDIGCATGASVLEMSKYFSNVIGLDYSEVFVHLAQELVRTASGHVNGVTYTAPDQGDIVVERRASVPPGTFPERCLFFRGDAMRLFEGESADADMVAAAQGLLPSRYDDVAWYQVPRGVRFDAVLAANLLCRVADPRRLLDAFPRLLRPGGVLVLASPYSWWEGATAREKWIGGLPGGPRSEEIVKDILAQNFDLLSETDEAFLIRDHVRRYQLGFAHCTVWRRR